MITRLIPITQIKLEILFEIYASKQTYLREISRAVKKSPSFCAKSLSTIRKSGLIEETKSGRNIYYTLIRSYKTDIIIRLLEEVYLEKACTKSAKLKTLINLARNNADLISACKAIYVFGSYARGTFTEKSDIDMLFLTEKKVIAARFIREASILIHTEINGAVMDSTEFERAINKKEPFTLSILENPKDRLVVWRN